MLRFTPPPNSLSPNNTDKHAKPLIGQPVYRPLKPIKDHSTMFRIRKSLTIFFMHSKEKFVKYLKFCKIKSFYY